MEMETDGGNHRSQAKRERKINQLVELQQIHDMKGKIISFNSNMFEPNSKHHPISHPTQSKSTNPVIPITKRYLALNV